MTAFWLIVERFAPFPKSVTPCNLDPKYWLTKTEAAASARVSPSTVRRWRKENLVRAIQTQSGRWLHYEPDCVEAAKARQEPEPPEPINVERDTHQADNATDQALTVLSDELERLFARCEQLEQTIDDFTQAEFERQRAADERRAAIASRNAAVISAIAQLSPPLINAIFRNDGFTNAPTAAPGPSDEDLAEWLAEKEAAMQSAEKRIAEQKAKDLAEEIRLAASKSNGASQTPPRGNA
jgi:hypothetical protein